MSGSQQPKAKGTFARDAIRGAVVMLFIPFILLLVFSRQVDHLVGVQMGWQDMARGMATAIFVYVVVMRQRYRRYVQ